MRPGPPYDTAKGQPQPLSPRDFKSKKLEIPLAPMLNRCACLLNFWNMHLLADLSPLTAANDLFATTVPEVDEWIHRHEG